MWTLPAGEDDGWVYKNLIANYSHLRSTHVNPWANRFVEFVRSKVNTNDTILDYSLELSEG